MINYLWRNEDKMTKAGVVIENSTFEREARMGFLPPTQRGLERDVVYLC
jgi:hypothetical protein